MQLFSLSCGFLNDLREVKLVPTSRESQFYFKMTSLHPFMTFFSLFSLYCEEQDFIGEGPSARALCPGSERQSRRSKVECPDNRAFPGVTNEELISFTAEMS
jgi:hypothetical protein